jgi:hypothetical protein
MDSVKYIGMDVHKEAICIAVLNSSGKLVIECLIETKASTILQFFQGLNWGDESTKGRGLQRGELPGCTNQLNGVGTACCFHLSHYSA